MEYTSRITARVKYQENYSEIFDITYRVKPFIGLARGKQTLSPLTASGRTAALGVSRGAERG